MRTASILLAVSLLVLSEFTALATDSMTADIGLGPTTRLAGPITIALDGREVCRFDGSPGPGAEPCRVDIPADAARLELRAQGRLPVIGLPFGRREATVDLVGAGDLAAVWSGPDPSAALADLPRRLDQVLRDAGSALTAADWGVGTGPTETAGDLDAAEARLGFPLDSVHRRLLAAGRPELGDSALVGAAGLARADRQMIDLWGEAEADVAALPDGLRALLARATMIFVEAGDGYGAILYEPRSERCGGGPAYWSIHQDRLERPILVHNSDGGCGGFADAMRAALAEDLLGRIADDLAADQLLVLPGATLRLTLVQDPRDHGIRLVPDWSTLR